MTETITIYNRQEPPFEKQVYASAILRIWTTGQYQGRKINAFWHSGNFYSCDDHKIYSCPKPEREGAVKEWR